VADLGIHGTVGDPGDDWAAHMERVLGALPPIVSTFWISDHLQQDGEPWPEGWTRLTWLAARLPRWRVGTLVLSQSYRNPGLLAAMASTLQTLTRGRLVLGLGAGWLEEEYRAFGDDYPSGGTRVAQLAETIEILRAVWSGGPASYEGAFYRVDGAVVVRPEPPIPILIGTNGPKALKVVARHADWWVWDGPLDVSYRRPMEILRAECEAIGRPFDSITRVAELAVALPVDAAEFRRTYEHVAYPGQTFAVSGPTSDVVIRDIEDLVDAGVSHIALTIDSEAELDRFVAEVLPQVRLGRNP
jgi:alkanesulfonate monooxygenase SsuD/methylene tetrahydromethanopterin reductase-like flavin-dependent oxidoreductase (luciferase family)